MDPICTCGHSPDEHGPLGKDDSRLHTMGCHLCDCTAWADSDDAPLTDEEEEEALAEPAGDDDEDDLGEDPDDDSEDEEPFEDVDEGATDVDVTILPGDD